MAVPSHHHLRLDNKGQGTHGSETKEGNMMGRTMCCLLIAGSCLGLSACNTTKATIDSTVKFFSSTSPDTMFTADGMVEQKQKINLFAGVAYENLRQESAAGSGEYVTALAA